MPLRRPGRRRYLFIIDNANDQSILDETGIKCAKGVLAMLGEDDAMHRFEDDCAAGSVVMRARRGGSAGSQELPSLKDITH